jgi:hypothetical protein
MVDIPKRTIRCFDSIDSSVVKAILQQVYTPILCVKDPPKWLKNFNVQYSGMNSCSSLRDRLFDWINIYFKIPPDDFVFVPALESQCAPISRFTAAQLGLVDNIGTVSLIDYCISKDSSVPEKNQMKKWINCPPINKNEIWKTINTLRVWEKPIPKYIPKNIGKYFKILKNPTIDGLKMIHTNTIATMELIPYYYDLWNSLMRENGYHKVEVDDFYKYISCVEECIHNSLAEEYECINSLRNELNSTFEQYPPGTRIDDNYGQGLRLSPNGDPLLYVKDKYGNIIPNRSTTQKIIDLELELSYSKTRLKDTELSLITSISTKIIEEYKKSIVCIESFILQFATIYSHVQTVGTRWTLPCENKTDFTMTLTNLVPYWIHGGIKNDINIPSGCKIIITGQNGFGKTTLMRSIAAAALLSQCGLMVPCANASIPYFSHIFLRGGGLDNAYENKSSFESEMSDVSTMLTAKGPTLLLLDEGCRSTNIDEGKRLLKSIIEGTSEQSMSLFSTHFDDIGNVHADWMQMIGCRQNDNCVPKYKLEYGKCNKQYALEKALKAGLPINIVLSARKKEDVDILIMILLENLELKYERFEPDTHVPVPCLCSVLYIATVQPNTIYVGESDTFKQRIKQHMSTKTIESMFMVMLENKTKARDYESIIIQHMKKEDVLLYSTTDGNHVVKQVL